MAMCMRDVVIIQGIVGLTGMRFTLGVLVDCMSKMFFPLGVSYTGLQLIVVGLQFLEFLFMRDVVESSELYGDVHVRCCYHPGYYWSDRDAIHPGCTR